MKRTLIIIGVAILLGGGGFFAFNAIQNQADQEPERVVFDEPTISEAVEEEVVEFDKADYEINVLNGSGTAGEAGTVQKILEDFDYVVANTDNADSYDYVATEIQAKSDVPKAYLDKLEEELSEYYTIKITDSLSDDDEYDVVVIVGSEKVKGSSSDDDADDTEDSKVDDSKSTSDEEENADVQGATTDDESEDTTETSTDQ